MGFPTKVQLNQRQASEQWYINFPSALAQAMEFARGERVEWFVEDKGLLVLRRAAPPRWNPPPPSASPPTPSSSSPPSAPAPTPRPVSCLAPSGVNLLPPPLHSTGLAATARRSLEPRTWTRTFLRLPARPNPCHQAREMLLPLASAVCYANA